VVAFGRLKTKGNFKLYALKMVAVAYESLGHIGSNFSLLNYHMGTEQTNCPCTVVN